MLLECPADVEAALAIATHPELRPPVALLVYNPKQQGQASFLPFAEFSPEWQAIQWCARHAAHVRCMDLPMALRFGMKDAVAEALAPASAPEPAAPDLGPASDTPAASEPADVLEADPVAYIARLAGYSDSEQWWETHLEHAPGNADTFAVVLDLMTALREELARPETE